MYSEKQRELEILKEKMDDNNESLLMYAIVSFLSVINSFVRHYFEKVILKHYKLEEEVKPFYTEIEYV